MRLSLRSLLAPSLALSMCLTAPSAFAQEDDPNLKNWQMFAHFVNVARPAQAQPFGEKLLELDNTAFLAAVEGDRLHRIEEIAKWGINDELRPTWEKIENKYQQALTDRSRNPEQIRKDIQDLGKNRTAEYLAIQRLESTGQFATPYYLEVLQDPSQKKLHPRVINAMIEVGAELTYPLSIALPHVDAPTQEYIALIVGEIGYPEAMPYLKMIIESDAAGASVKNACSSALNKIAETSGISASGSAADLFVRIGQAKYATGTRNGELLGMDLPNETGIIWRYNSDTGLFPIAVAQRVYADALAMQNAASALSLAGDMDTAVTLHLASNLRRENRLEGERDPGYNLANPAPFYLLVAGAPQQKAVLTQGLTDTDADLSLDAIEAMAQTVGDQIMLGVEDANAPVLDALYFPDRRVRYTAAFTLASAAPAEKFPGSINVVPVLGQAVRQSEKLNAVVVAPGGANSVVEALENIDFKAVGDADLGLASTKASASMPGVDLILYSGDLAGFEATYAATKADGSLGVAPILALVSDGVASAIKISYPGVQTAAPLSSGDDNELDRLERLSKQAISTYGGKPITDEEAENYALTALDMLKTIAAHETIYNAQDIEAILVQALDDNRVEVAIAAGKVLEQIDSDAAQRGLAAAGFERLGLVQIALLDSLAASAKQHGNKLPRPTIDKLIELVNTSTGDTALSAARALGALTERPTSDTTRFILGQ